MFLILLSWIYIFLTTLNFGILFKKIVRIKDCHSVIHHVLGLFLYTIFTSIAAFFIRINIELYVAVLIINLIVYFTNRTAFISNLKSFSNSIKKLRLFYKIVFINLFTITLAQSATKPYLLDNESYYIQTVKWINEFGYVKGLANLHIFFAQNSAWHTLQAGFNFSFISDLFNDLNGYLFVLISFLAIEKINNYKSNLDLQSLSFGLILLFTLFFMQFINAPSPDLFVFTLTPFVFYQFITNFKTIETDTFKMILSLVLFLCFVKVTTAVLVVLVLILFFKNFQSLKKHWFNYTLLCSVVFIVFISKNIIISGYLLFPIDAIDLFNFDWKEPKPLVEFYNYGTYLAGFDNQDVSQLTILERFWFWLNISKLHGLFNKLFVLLLTIYPWFIYKSKTKSALSIIYVLAVLQLIILWNGSPQYRFFFVFIMFFSIQVFLAIFKQKKLILFFVPGSVFLSAIPIFLEVNLNAITKNPFAMKLSTFNSKNILIPEGISKTTTVFTKENSNGFEFNSPGDDVFFWATGNGNLPCVNKQQIEFVKNSYNYVPQLRTTNLKDGFKSIKIEE
ncbi:LIC_10190 family membrane protein [Lutibacter flavus]|uniref:DUF8201 domain-containing protein n=1 Tax=Lutibacter flavus TaxID=691689 RepID=A0A238WZD4_9FLAO|nr:hypothetical protein [Lutibacter flavus]SNR51800.1 hypothetical protein SAMN04488111_1375 [Lutibacter flavus]